MEDALAHQMIHMFDHATTSLNWSNAQQMACSEIRATNLSGECRWMREFMRGYLGTYSDITMLCNKQDSFVIAL